MRRNLAILCFVFAGLALAVCWLAVSIASFRGRRRLVRHWRRMRRWEFWPPWVFYPPVVAYVLYLGARFRSSTLFTACNPQIPAGGFIGESKSEILQRLDSAGSSIARWTLLQPGNPQARFEQARSFIRDSGLEFPVILKPDAGQRGSGVSVVRSPEGVSEYLSRFTLPVILQEYVPGKEFGVFYYRRPREATGHVFSVTEKQMPVLVGDGRQTLEELILEDDRAVCMSDFYLRKNSARSQAVIANGERVQLVEIGTHCRGAIFLDGAALITPALEKAIDQLAWAFQGFYFGRFDIRVPSAEDFRAGRNLKVIELNGVTSEATHIYDPSLSLFEAYGVLFRQWRLAFEIGDANRQRGTQPVSAMELLRASLKYRRDAREHLE